MRVLIACALAGCYSPALLEGLPCSESGDCPDGQSCVPGQGVCVVEAAQMSVNRIAVGDESTCAIGVDGRRYCWGRNHIGQLGLGDRTDRDRPTLAGDDVIGAYRDISIGNVSVCVIDTSNDLFCAGARVAGTGGTATLTPVEAGQKWSSVSVGEEAMCAVNDGGDVWCALEDGTAMTEDATGYGFVRVAYQHETRCALDEARHLWCWGINSEGQIGTGDAGDPISDPFETGGDDEWIDVDLGYQHVCALRADGTVWCWGDNNDGQLGDGTFEDAFEPQQVPGLSDIVDVDVGTWHSCAVSGAGRTWCWGEGIRGQLGDGVGDVSNPVPRELDVELAAISAGGVHTCGLDFDGGAWCWGDDANGQLGDGRIGRDGAPDDLGAGDDWRSISIGHRHACGITGVGLQCWGRNGHGQVGNGSTARALVPAIVDATATWIQVAASVEHTCAIKEPGRIACWGSNTASRLGLPDETLDRLVPTDVGDRDDWEKVAVSVAIGCAIDADAELWCWGDGEQDPVLVPGGPGWTDVAGSSDPGDDYVTALRGGELFQVSPSELTPIVPATADWTAATRGPSHVCGLRPGGEVWCAGYNPWGQLGDGTTDESLDAAVRAGDEAGWTAIAAGGEFSCGLQGSALSCWGRNDQGQVGNGGDEDTIVDPAAVSDGWASVAAGRDTACAIDDGGRVSCWGYDLGLDGGWDVPVWVVPP